MKKGVGLYIHIPFCKQKCNYCDFVSYSNDDKKEQYLEAMFKEMDTYKGLKVDTVFIGGGTPTYLDCHLLERLLEKINKSFCLADRVEFTCEVNPGTINDKKLETLKKGGVNRLSIGVQSFVDAELKALGRIHNSVSARDSVLLARKYFDNINIDIMTNIPGQTTDSLKETLDILLELEPEHISCYSLIIEEGTPFYKMYNEGKLSLWSDDEDRENFRWICQTLEANGYTRYEISNFAKPERQSRHNLKYWNTLDYVGIGAAAHSCLNSKRYSNAKDLREYIKDPSKPAEIIDLTLEDEIKEYIIMSLRTKDGVNLNTFKERFDSDFEAKFQDRIKSFLELGLMKKTAEGYALTDDGMDISNSIMCEFL